MRASRLFSVPAFRFSIVDPKSAVGKWSRIATFGHKSKDGAEMMFDATTLGQMVDNAAARGDRIAIDNDHASAYPETRDAPALGFFGALAVVAGGKVVKSWNGAPDPAGLDDGLYGRLDEITPRGTDPLVGLANYRTMSPMFVEEGTDEQNRPIGYALLNVAATNIPFQSGAEIMFFGVPAQGATAMGWNASLKPGDKIRDNRTGKVGTVKAIQRDGAAEVWWDSVDHGLIMPQGEPPPDLEKLSQSNTGAARASKGASMNPEVMKKIGLADGCSPQDKMAKFAAYAMGDASPDELKAMADDLDLAEDPAAKAMAAKLRKFALPFDGEETPEEEKAEEKAKVEMSRHLGGKASWKGALELFTTQRHTTIDKADLVPLRAKVAELEQKLAEREKGERENAIVTFAREAIAAGSWDPSDEAGLIEFRRSAPDAAAKNVEKNRGRWKALQAFTVGGHPVGKGPGAVSTGGKSNGRGAELAAAAEEIVAKDPELLKLSRTNRAEAMTMAMDRAYEKDPSLYR